MCVCLSVCVCVCVRVCVPACLRACVRACVRNETSETWSNVTGTSVVITVDSESPYNASVSSWTRLGDGGVVVSISFTTLDSGTRRGAVVHPVHCVARPTGGVMSVVVANACYVQGGSPLIQNIST